MISVLITALLLISKTTWSKPTMNAHVAKVRIAKRFHSGGWNLYLVFLAGLAVLWIPPVKITIRNRQIIVRICQITVKNRCHSTLYIISRPQYTYKGVNKYHVCRLLRTQTRLAQFMGLLCSINTDLVRRTNIFSCYLFFTFRDKLWPKCCKFVFSRQKHCFWMAYVDNTIAFFVSLMQSSSQTLELRSRQLLTLVYKIRQPGVTASRAQ